MALLEPSIFTQLIASLSDGDVSFTTDARGPAKQTFTCPATFKTSEPVFEDGVAQSDLILTVPADAGFEPVEGMKLTVPGHSNSYTVISATPLYVLNPVPLQYEVVAR